MINNCQEHCGSGTYFDNLPLKRQFLKSVALSAVTHYPMSRTPSPASPGQSNEVNDDRRVFILDWLLKQGHRDIIESKAVPLQKQYRGQNKVTQWLVKHEFMEMPSLVKF